MATQEYIKGNGRWLASGNFNYDLLKAPVTKIHLCAIPILPFCMPGVSPINHWNVCFEFAESGSSLRLDPTQGIDLGLHLILEIIQAPHLKSVAHKLSITLPEGTMLNTLLNIIIKRGRDRYQFTDAGEGCRYWIMTLIEDLHSEELVSSDDKGTAAQDLAKYWKHPQGSGSEPNPIVQGSFNK
jgi:hypothetical protein